MPPGDARTITLTRKHPFSTGEYNTIGPVSESGESCQAIELAHIVTPQVAAGYDPIVTVQALVRRW